jgi:hypothetical protein
MILLYLDVEIFFSETLDYSYFNCLNTWYLGAEVSFKFRRGPDHGYARSGGRTAGYGRGSVVRRHYDSFAA